MNNPQTLNIFIPMVIGRGITNTAEFKVFALRFSDWQGKRSVKIKH